MRRSPSTGKLPSAFSTERRTSEELRCGTPKKYTLGCKCFDCSDSNRYKMAAYRRRLEEGRQKKPHGCSRNTSERCEACKTKARKRKAELDKVKKAQRSSPRLVICANCGKVEVVTDGRSARRKYCSNDCQWSSRSASSAASTHELRTSRNAAWIVRVHLR